jgi:hypothetical protein
VAWHQGDNLYAYRVNDESRSQVERALDYTARIVLGEQSLAAAEPYPCECHAGSGYDMAYNHYKYRNTAISSNLTTLERAFADSATCDEVPVDNVPDGNHSRPDGAYSMFIGWTTATHGMLSSP